MHYYVKSPRFCYHLEKQVGHYCLYYMKGTFGNEDVTRIGLA
jgi:hypothetical protein